MSKEREVLCVVTVSIAEGKEPRVSNLRMLPEAQEIILIMP